MDKKPVFARLRQTAILLTMLVGIGAVTLAQAGASLDVFWIFLHDGRVLSSYGEYARVGDDLVFLVMQGDDGSVQTHDLVTVPVAKVDMDRTQEYAGALRAARYGATRGEAEYQAFTADISRAMEALQASDDRDRRLGIAQVARVRLASWSQDHFGYRAEELRHVTALMDDVIVQLQAAAGVSHFSIDFVALAEPLPAVPLRSGPTAAGEVSMALTAASVTEVGVEKLALLRSASRVAATLPDSEGELKAEVERALAEETAVEQAYQRMIRTALTRADLAVRQGKPAVIRQLIIDIEAEDARLGHGRPKDIARTLRQLWGESGLAVDQKTALDRWAEIKDELQAYEGQIKAVLKVLDSHEATLLAVRDGRLAGPSQLDAAVRRFAALDRVLAALHPPDELHDVHGAFRSALQLARQGLAIGQRLAVAANTALAANASSAITGALLLRDRAIADLAIAVEPRRVR